MIFTSIRYGYTKNLGNYQLERLELEADLEPGDDPSEAYQVLRDRVHDELQARQRVTSPVPASACPRDYGTTAPAPSPKYEDINF